MYQPIKLCFRLFSQVEKPLNLSLNTYACHYGGMVISGRRFVHQDAVRTTMYLTLPVGWQNR